MTDIGIFWRIADAVEAGFLVLIPDTHGDRRRVPEMHWTMNSRRPYYGSRSLGWDDPTERPE